MTSSCKRCIAIGTLFVAAWLCCFSEAAAIRAPIPDGLFYYRPAAGRLGSEAAWVNPAALFTNRAYAFQLMTDYRNGGYFDSWGVAVERQTIAVAYRYLNNPEGEDYEEYVLAGGMGIGRTVALGIAYRWFKNGPGIYDKRHYWNISAALQGTGPFRLAAVLSNLNRGKIGDERSEMEQRYSLSYQPYDIPLTLSADAFLSSGQKLSEADLVYHAAYMVSQGLFVEGRIDSDRSFQIGLRANILQYFTGWQGDFTRGGSHSSSTVYGGATSNYQESIVSHK